MSHSLPFRLLQQAWIKSQVTAQVFKLLNDLQHPPDCTQARKLVCKLNASQCGFGCQIHHAVHCLAHALALNRTLILKVGTVAGRQLT